MKKSLLALLLFVGVFFLAACAVEPESLTLNATQVALEVGETFSLTVEVSPEDAEYDAVEYSSANTSIVTVNSSGLLTAVGAGTTSVTVAVGDDLSGFVQVTVSAPVVEPEPEPEPEPEEDPVAVQVSSLATDITVPYGTPVAEVIELLPATAIVEDDEGEEYVVDLRWVVLNYSATASPEASEDYIASATFRLPDGVKLGSLVTKIDVMVTVQPTLARLALTRINEDPANAPAADFVAAGIEGVTEANVSQIVPALVAAKGDSAFPDWTYAQVQAVVDGELPGLLGTIYDVPAPELVWDMTIEMSDASKLVSVEVRSGDLYERFLAAEINDLLLAFLEGNEPLLNNQRVAFEFTLETATTDKELIRMTYLELTVVSTEALEIPNSLLFNGLVIDGMGYELGNLTIGADNLVVRNLELPTLNLSGIARNVKLSDLELTNLDVNIASNVIVNRVSVSLDIESDVELNITGDLLLPDSSTLEIGGFVNNLTIVLVSELAKPLGSTVNLKTSAAITNLVMPLNVDLTSKSGSAIDGLSALGNITVAGELLVSGLIELNGASVNEGTLVLDGAQLFAGDLASDVTIKADSEGNEIHNSTVSGVLTVNAPLVMAAPAFDNGSTSLEDGAELTLAGGTYDGGYTVTAKTGSSVVFAAPITLTNGALTIDGTGEVSGLANLPIEVEGKFVSGQTWSINVAGTALDFEWQSATTVGISVGTYTTAKTGSAAYTLSEADSGKLVRLVVTNDASEDVVTLAAIGPVDDNVWNATASSVTVLHDPSVPAGTNNMEILIELKTENGYDLISSGDYTVSVTLGALTLTSQSVSLSATGSAVISFTVTGAAAYENIGVKVASNKSGSATLFVGETFDVTVTATTPTSIELLTPSAVTNLPADSSTNLSVLVTDTNGNPVPNAEVFFLAEGPALESDTAFSAESYMTNADGIATATMNVSRIQLGEQSIAVSISSAGVNKTLPAITTKEVVSADSSASVSGGSITSDAAVDFSVVVDLENTFASPKAIVNQNLEMLLVLGTLEDGTVVSTASAISWGSATGTATFAIDIAGEHTLNLYVETYVDSGEFVLVQSGLSIDIEATDPAELVADPKTDVNVEIALGGSADVEVTVKDEQGNALPGIFVEWEVKGATSNATLGAGSVTGVAQTDANGVLAATLVIGVDETAGTNAVQLVFKVSGEAIRVEYNIDVLSLVTTADSSMDTVVSPSTITAGENLEVDLYLENASGTAVNGSAYDIYLELADGTTMAAVSADYSNGTTTAVFTITEAGAYAGVSVFVETADGSGEFVELPGSLSFTIEAAAVDPSKTVITPADTALALTKGQSADMVVTVTDAFGNPVSGITVAAVLAGRLNNDTALEGASNGTSLSVLTGADGKATVTLEIGVNEPRSNDLTVTVTVSDAPSGTEEVFNIEVVAFTPTDMVENGDFSGDDLTPYTNFVDNSATATFNLVDGAVEIDVEKGGSAFWAIQFKQEGKTLEQGISYQLSFDAKAEAARDISVVFYNGDTGINYLQSGPVALTTEMQTFVFVFTMDVTIETQLQFLLGTVDNFATGIVTIDNILLSSSGE